jgi:hypothetical protein
MKTIAIISLLLLSGCVSLNTPMVNPRTYDTLPCHAWGFGWLGVPVALVSHSNCVSDLKKAGYVPAEELRKKPAFVTGK